MSGLPASALLAVWLDAVRAGRAGPDDLATAVQRDDPRHLVVGLPESGALDLVELPARLPGPVSLALAAPGDLVGLGGPPDLNRAVIEAGEAVIIGGVGLVPEEDARTVLWRVRPASPAPFVDERETAVHLRTTLAEVTRALVDLDVAAWQPEIPDLLMDLRRRPVAPLPPGFDGRRAETVERAALCMTIVELARSGEGGAVSAYEMERRGAALAALGRAARHALVGACQGRSA